MKITVEISNVTEIERFFSLVKMLQLDNIQVVTASRKEFPTIQKGNKNLNPRALFGIWENDSRNVDGIRIDAWKRAE